MAAPHQHLADVADTYGSFITSRSSPHIYPNEWVIRSVLGTYPELSLGRLDHAGRAVLDLGVGDGRNLPVFHDHGYRITGVDVSTEIIERVARTCAERGIDAELLVGRNHDIPCDDDSFDLVLASHSCYYIDEGVTFEAIVAEMLRVLRPGGTLLATLVNHHDNAVLRDSVDLGGGYRRIVDDPHGLRNGYVHRTFASREEVVDYFTPHGLVAVGSQVMDYWGLQISCFMIAVQP